MDGVGGSAGMFNRKSFPVFTLNRQKSVGRRHAVVVSLLHISGDKTIIRSVGVLQITTPLEWSRRDA